MIFGFYFNIFELFSVSIIYQDEPSIVLTVHSCTMTLSMH